MEFQMLGPFDVVVDGRSVRLQGTKQRALLALLALHPNEVLSTDRLIDELWHDEPPESALNTLQGYVSRLRKVLDGSNGGAPAIEYRAPGYVLNARPEQIDARRFERLLAQAETLAARGDAVEAGRTLRTALELWRGGALSDFAHEPFAQAEIVRLEELRLTAVEDRIEADLACGRHAALVAELEALVSEHPLRERLCGQLMLALYRGGRQGEALSAYRAARRRLDEELGIEPTSALRGLERAILEQDPSLESAASSPVESPPHRPRRQRWIVAAAAAALAMAAAAAGFVVFGGADSAAPARVVVKPHSVAVIDPQANAVVADLGVEGWPRALTAGGGFVWAGNSGDDTVSRIDPVSRLVLDSFFATTPLDLALRDGVMWIANGNSFDGPDPPGGGTVERYELETRKLTIGRVGPATPGNGEQTVVAAGREGVWAGNADEARVYRLDPRTGKVTATVQATIQVAGIAVGAGSVWAADPINDVVFRIEPETARVLARIPVADGPRRLVVGEGAVWVLGEFPRSGVWRIDPDVNRAVTNVAVPRRANWIAVGGGSVWVTSNNPGHAGPGSLSRIDAKTNELAATIDLGFSPEDVVVANGLVWVAIGPM